ncbi:hypothetical protein GQ44DRAFT_723739 [Phaeosphaeriaceae sp. PMI808]|nr:hypothetical protein GQ44DRAFT_723739 [Phaeosphaeriaceae sp. PMI808]
MPDRILVKFRTGQIPYSRGTKLKYVADAACSALLDRNFDYQRDFLHSRGDIFGENALCHILIDCEYLDYESSQDIVLHSYDVEDGSSEDAKLLVPCSSMCRPLLMINVEIFEKPMYSKAKLRSFRGRNIQVNGKVLRG